MSVCMHVCVSCMTQTIDAAFDKTSSPDYEDSSSHRKHYQLRAQAYDESIKPPTRGWIRVLNLDELFVTGQYK
jgi:hypothetical protein